MTSQLKTGSWERTPFRMPGTKAEAQAVMRGFAITGLKVMSIEDDRIFALTGPILQPDGQMRRLPRTVILAENEDGDVGCRYLQGWIVTNDDPAAALSAWP